MAAEERLLRLENAFVTLVELAAKADGRLDIVDDRLDQFDDRLDKLLTLALSGDERLSQHQLWLNELGAAQANSEARIAALADAQIRLAESQAQAQARIDAALKELAEAQAHTDRRLDALIDIISEDRNGKS